MYEGRIKRSAQKELRAFDDPLRKRLLKEIRAFADNPRPAGCRKLVGSNDRWRIRVGDYRIVYTIDDTAAVVEVVIVRHRSAAYE